MILSASCHFLLIVLVPLVIGALRKTSAFERPSTFQLVAVPASLRPVLTDLSQSRKTELDKERKKSTKSAPGANESREENLKELAALLDETFAPASISAIGDNRYNWYLAQTQSRIERFWNPPVEDRNDSVVVSFTIFKNGSVSEPAVYRGSKNNTLNEMALQAVRLAAPFGRLPPGVSGDRYEILCTLRPARK